MYIFICACIFVVAQGHMIPGIKLRSHTKDTLGVFWGGIVFRFFSWHYFFLRSYFLFLARFLLCQALGHVSPLSHEVLLFCCGGGEGTPRGAGVRHTKTADSSSGRSSQEARLEDSGTGLAHQMGLLVFDWALPAGSHFSGGAKSAVSSLSFCFGSHT